MNCCHILPVTSTGSDIWSYHCWTYMSWCFILRYQFIDYVITFWEHLNKDFSLNCRHPNSPILMPCNVCYLAGRAEEAEDAACWHPWASSRHSCQPRAAAPAGCLRLHVGIRIYRSFGFSFSMLICLTFMELLEFVVSTDEEGESEEI